MRTLVSCACAYFRRLFVSVRERKSLLLNNFRYRFPSKLSIFLRRGAGEPTPPLSDSRGSDTCLPRQLRGIISILIKRG